MSDNERFIILKDGGEDLIDACIRDCDFEIDDIYGDYNYDDLEQICSFLNKLNDENNQLKQLIDLCASDICRLVKILSDYNIDYEIDYELHSDVTNFITKWGVRIE